MSFQFVDNGKIDADTRRRIRSHCMKGKNAGKVLPPRKRPRKETSEEGTVKRSKADSEQSITVLSTLGNEITAFELPCKWKPYMAGLAHQFLAIKSMTKYPVEPCDVTANGTSPWFKYLLTDAAFFHSTLAMSEVCTDVISGRRETSLRGVQHLTKAYHYINQNLQKRGKPSDATVGAVLNMAMHDDFRGHPERGKVHLAALQQMVKLRGGLNQFIFSRVLVQKICRADIEYALHGASRPCFYRDEFPRELVQSMLDQRNAQGELLQQADDIGVYESCLRGVFVDMMNVSYLLNAQRTCFKSQPHAFQDMLISACYRLLHHNAWFENELEDDVEHACRLGLLALMTTTIYQIAVVRLSYNILSERLRNAIDKISISDSIDETFLLWLLFAGGISIFGADDEPWLYPRIRHCISLLNINSWQSTRDKIGNLPWMNAANDEPGRKLWYSVFHGMS